LIDSKEEKLEMKEFEKLIVDEGVRSESFEEASRLHVDCI